MAIVILALGEAFSRWNEGDCASALASDLLKHGKIVFAADAKILGDHHSLAFLRQNTGEEAPAFIAGEPLALQSQRMRKRDCL